jgi:PilZ domain-containing protein
MVLFTMSAFVSSPSEIGSVPRAASFRAHCRRAVRLHALASHASGWERYVLVQNVSIGGACIAVDEPLEPGDSMSLSVSGPTLWDPLLLLARIAWVETSASLRRREELSQSSGERASARHAGLAFEHRSRDAICAWYELIATL